MSANSNSSILGKKKTVPRSIERNITTIDTSDGGDGTTPYSAFAAVELPLAQLLSYLYIKYEINLLHSENPTFTHEMQTKPKTNPPLISGSLSNFHHTPHIQFTVPPRISPFNFEDDITEGMRTQLMCSSSQGDQPFNITWLKDQQSLDASIDRTININEYAPFSSILTIHNLTSGHNGNYTCQISNRGGAVQYTALLSVAGALKLTNNFFFKSKRT